MTAVFYVLTTAALMVLWGVLSSRFPRFAVLANSAAVIYVILTPPLGTIGLGWTVLAFLTVGFGLFAALGGLIEQRQRAMETFELPRARARTARN